MITDFENKVALITGGSNGIGFALARACLDRGMRVAITASREESRDAALAKLDGGDRLMAFVSDAGDRAAIEKLAAEIIGHWGGVNLLCLNAGISSLSPLHELSIESWDAHMAINLNGPFYAVKTFLPYLEAQEQSHILITSSIFSLFAAGMQAAYFATKAGLTALAESLYYDLQAAGSAVGVSVSCPGNTATNMAERNLTGDEDPELAAAIRSGLAAGTDPMTVAADMLDAVSSNRFYSLPNTGEYQTCIDARNARIAALRNPAWEDIGETV